AVGRTADNLRQAPQNRFSREDIPNRRSVAALRSEESIPIRPEKEAFGFELGQTETMPQLAVLDVVDEYRARFCPYRKQIGVARPGEAHDVLPPEAEIAADFSVFIDDEKIALVVTDCQLAGIARKRGGCHV